MRLKFKLISIFSCIAVIMSPTAGAFSAEEVVKIHEIVNFLTRKCEPHSEEFKGISESDILSKMINFFIHKMPYECEHIKDIQTMYDIILRCKSRLEKLEFIEDGLYDKLVEQEEIYAETLNDLKISQINKFLDYGIKPVFSEISGDSEVEILKKIYRFLDRIKDNYVISCHEIENMRNIIRKMNIRSERFKDCNFDSKKLETWLLRKEIGLKLSEIENFFLNKNFSLLSEFSSNSEKKSIYKMYLFLRDTELKNCKNQEYIKYLYEVSVRMKNYLIETGCLDDFLSFNLKAFELLYNSHVSDFYINKNPEKSICCWKETAKMYCLIKEMLINRPYKAEPYDASFEDILYMEKYCLKNVLYREGILHYKLKDNLKALKLFCESYCLLRNKKQFDIRDKKWRCIPECVKKISEDVKKLSESNQHEKAFRMIIELVKQLIIIDYDPAFIDSCKEIIFLNIFEIFNQGEQSEIKNLYKEARRAYFIALEGAIFMNNDYYKLMCRQRIDSCMEKLRGTTDAEILELND